MNNLVFVYGTLLPGFWNHHIIEKFVVDSREATVMGRLYTRHRGSYPYLVQEEEDAKSWYPVKGRLITLVNEQVPDAIARMDKLEGYNFGGDPLDNLYQRVWDGVLDVNNVSQPAYYYRWNVLRTFPKTAFVEITDGDWASFTRGG